MLRGRKMLLPLALALGAVGITVMPATAGATHARPKGATPLSVPFVPAYTACGTPNRQHGPPLAFPSCNPPTQASSFVTVGTPDANGATANSVGSFTVKVIHPTCCPPQDVAVTTSITDVRCKGATTACGNANATGGADYVGELQVNSTIRMTDHFNATAPGGGTDPATMVDIPFPVALTCANTADTSIGATCSVGTQPVSLFPQGTTAKRAIVEMSQFQVFDGGADGQNATQGNTLFAVQGLFIP
jgi:hypothetical protein